MFSKVRSLLQATFLLWISTANAQLFDNPPGGLIGAATIVVGDYLYIDGGQFTRGNGRLYGQLNTQTLAIDLRSSWTPETVKTTQISTGSPKADQYLFYSPSDESLYRFGGRFVQARKFSSSSNPGLESLPIAGVLNPEWTISRLQPPSSIIPPYQALYARSSDSLYLLGGVDDSARKHAYELPGIVRYDISHRKWTNDSSEGYLQGYGNQGVGVYAPNFGEKGILVFLGGIDPLYHKESWNHGDKTASLANIHVYDIASRKFYSQKATSSSGFMPHGRYEFCAVGVEDRKSGGFDIFIYGGTFHASIDTDRKVDDDESVWVLSLPSFEWMRIHGVSPGREISSYHSCEVIGNRQMAVIGGIAGYYKFPEKNFSAGPFIFDMSELRWRDTYYPDLGPYERSPVLVNNAKRKPAPPQWGNSELKQIFIPSSSSNVGLIAGATVGGVVALCLIALAVWCFLRRRRKRSDYSKPLQKNLSDDQSYGYIDLQQPQEKDSKITGSTLAPTSLSSSPGGTNGTSQTIKPSELFGSPTVYEMAGGAEHSHVSELAARGENQRPHGGRRSKNHLPSRST